MTKDSDYESEDTVDTSDTESESMRRLIPGNSPERQTGETLRKGWKLATHPRNRTNSVITCCSIFFAVSILYLLFKHTSYTQFEFLYRDQKVWYFSYGSNMKEQTLIRRHIPFEQKLRGFLPHYRVAFTHKGWSPMEPSFASVKTKMEDEYPAYGVAYLVNLNDLQRLDTYEIGYSRIKVFLEVLSDDLHLNLEHLISVYTYKSLPEHDVPERPPSPRYLGLITSALKKLNFPKDVSKHYSSMKTQPWPSPDLNYMKNLKYDQNGMTNELFCRDGKSWTHLIGHVFDISSAPQGHKDSFAHSSMTTWVRGMWWAQYGVGNKPPEFKQFVQMNLKEKTYLFAALKWANSSYPLLGIVEEPVTC